MRSSMPDGERRVSVDAHELARISDDEAVAVVDEHLGRPEEWAHSGILGYRLEAEFQRPWKIQIGHWLYAAKRDGFIKGIIAEIDGQRRKAHRIEERDVHDPRYLKFQQHVVTAMFDHYLTGTGWSFVRAEDRSTSKVDIDLAMSAPDGTFVELQLKVPDRPGKLDAEDGRYHGGDIDQRVLAALDKAVGQLPVPARSVALVGLYALRSFSLATHPALIVYRVYGVGVAQEDREILIARDGFGVFLRKEWMHVAGIVLMDLFLGADLVVDGGKVVDVPISRYPSTVLLNPYADKPASPDWFPRSRVAVLEGDRFRWIRGAPGSRPGLWEGTRLVDEMP